MTNLLFLLALAFLAKVHTAAAAIAATAVFCGVTTPDNLLKAAMLIANGKERI